MDKKKRLILICYQVMVLLFMFLIVYQKDSVTDMILFPESYVIYIKELFLQLFLLINALFVLLIAFEHDEAYYKPLIAYHGLIKVLIYKYTYFIILIGLYVIDVCLNFYIIFELLTPLNSHVDLYQLSYFFLDMLVFMNFILIFFRRRTKYGSILIFMVYIAITFVLDVNLVYWIRIFPVFMQSKPIELLDIYYKICYIYLGFLIYMMKSIKQEQ